MSNYMSQARSVITTALHCLPDPDVDHSLQLVNVKPGETIERR